MDLKLSTSPEITRLKRESEDARSALNFRAQALRQQVEKVKYQLNVPAQVKKSLAGHPLAWIGGSLVTGLVLSRALRGRNQKKAVGNKYSKKGVKGMMLSVALAAAKPALRRWVTAKVKRKLADRFRHFYPNQVPAGPQDFRYDPYENPGSL